jgi:hypothetical protein
MNGLDDQSALLKHGVPRMLNDAIMQDGLNAPEFLGYNSDPGNEMPRRNVDGDQATYNDVLY